MQVAVVSVGRDFAEAAVRRTAVVVDVGQPFDDGRQKPLVDVACGEIGVPEVRFLIGIVEL